MSLRMIDPSEIPLWVSGNATVQSPDTGWDGVSVAGFQYPGSDVDVPAISDFLVVAYMGGVTGCYAATRTSPFATSTSPGR